jgi:hypothetical protein
MLSAGPCPFLAGCNGTVAEWLGRGLQNLVQQFESARYLHGKGGITALSHFTDMSRYTPWISLAAYLLLVASCFMPWTYHADLGKHFTGFFSEANTYGKPAKMLLALGGLCAIFSITPMLWGKRAALFVAGLNFAYAIKTFLVYGSCYRGYCPEKETGLFLMLAATVVLMVASMFPKGILKDTKSASGGEAVKKEGD